MTTRLVVGGVLSVALVAADAAKVRFPADLQQAGRGGDRPLAHRQLMVPDPKPTAPRLRRHVGLVDSPGRSTHRPVEETQPSSA
ncbi:MAG TPA: hypothetical protein VG205_00965 [Acidimicrobiales bacterium]|nr:hypothetical protein [Acidimicrobiales bacterium]